MNSPFLHKLRLLLAGGLLVVSVSIPTLHAAQLLPGVYGYGADRASNPAGFAQNFQVLRVTNVNDDGPGSLREAVETSGPRVVIFEVSGVIELEDELQIEDPHITIAGQTAPSPGISIHNATFYVRADNVLIQHLRIRPGDRWMDGGPTHNRDAIILAPDSDGVVSNVVIDHCTLAWSLDELAQAYGSYDNITFNKCIFAEPLFQSIHIDEDTHSTTQSSNTAKNAQTLNFSNTSGLPNPATATQSDTLAVGGSYHLVHSNSDDDYIEYQVPLIKYRSNRTHRHVIISGITGSNRGKFRVQVRSADDTLLKDYTSPNDYIDQYSDTPAQRTWVIDTPPDGEGGFTIPEVPDNQDGESTHLKIRLIVVGKHTSSSGRKLGIDLIGIGDQHSMGGIFSSGINGGGKVAIIGSVYSSLAARGPWASSKKMVFANNVLYNRWNMFMHVGHSSWSDLYNIAVLGNTFIEGPSWAAWARGKSPIVPSLVRSGAIVYAPTLAENSALGNAYDTGDYFDSTSAPPELRDDDLPGYENPSSPPTDPTLPYPTGSGMPGFAPLTAADAYDAAIDGAGARPADRDDHETGVIAEIVAAKAEPDLSDRPGLLKDSVADAGGWPDYPVIDNEGQWPIPYPSNPAGDAGDYTNIEVWLHQLAALVEGTNGGTPDPATPIHDNFEDNDTTGWTPAGTTNWSIAQVGTTDTPEHNRVYVQSSTTADARSLLTGTNWENQVIQVDIKPTAFDGTNRWFGVLGRYQDADNYYYLILRDSNIIDLKKIVNGTPESLLSSPPTFDVSLNTTYRIKLVINGTSLSGTVSTWDTTTNTWTGVQTVSATDSSLASGRTGVAMYRAAIQVNNVQASPNVSPTTMLADDFQDQMADGWTTTGGTWSVISSGGSYVYRQSAVSTSVYSHAGSTGWTDQVLELDARATSFGTTAFFGVVSRYTDTSNYYYFILRNNNRVELKKYVNGAQSLLDAAAFPVSTGTTYVLKLEAVGPTLNAYVNGRLVLEHQDDSLPAGKAGMKMYTTTAEYDDILVWEP